MKNLGLALLLWLITSYCFASINIDMNTDPDWANFTKANKPTGNTNKNNMFSDLGNSATSGLQTTNKSSQKSDTSWHGFYGGIGVGTRQGFLK